jgi:DNA processing protein
MGAATSSEDLRAWLALLRVPGLGAVRGQRLLQHFGSPVQIFAACRASWRSCGIPDEVCEALGQPDWRGVDQDLAWLDHEQRGIVTWGDARYPQRLREIALAPLALYYRGDAELLGLPQLAIVGARAASAQGIENAQFFAAELAQRGLTVTSGLALGIDAAAHRGALAADGLTIAVCGNGLDRVYPARNKELAHAIAERGLLLSELPPGAPPKAEHFPRRNRIISGLALGVLVVEAARESGSLITARLAAEQGRDVFAVPGSIHNPLARGCHALLREGARLVETVDDILTELGPQLPARPVAAATQDASGSNPAILGMDAVTARVLEALGFETVALERLVERLGLPVAQLSAILLSLELDGRVVSAPGDRFTRVQRF